jgi:hypothetical protein
MTAFASPKEAARAVLFHPTPMLNRRAGQFLGGTMFDDAPLSERQHRWLSDLLRKHDLPPLADGGGNA